MKLSAATLALLVAAACGDDLIIEPEPDPGAATAFVASADFSNNVGTVSTVAVPSLAVSSNVVAGAASSDPVVRTHGDRVYIVNRFGFDNLTVLRLADFSLVEQVSTGNGTNPQDVAVAAGKVFVAANDSIGVLVFDEVDLGAGIQSTIDLSALDPDDGDPDCSSLAVAGDKLYVACQVLDDFFTARGPGKIAVIEPATGAVETSFDLNFGNPATFLVTTAEDSAFGGDLLIATAPNLAAYDDGCIERIEVGASPGLAGCVLANSALGGYVTDMAVVGDTIAATVFTCTDGNCFSGPTSSALVPIDGANAELGARMSSDVARPTDVAACPTGHIITGDANVGGAPGIRVYDPSGTKLNTRPLDVGLPPTFTNGIVCY